MISEQAKQAAKTINSALGSPTDHVSRFIEPHIQTAIDSATADLARQLGNAQNTLRAIENYCGTDEGWRALAEKALGDTPHESTMVLASERDDLAGQLETAHELISAQNSNLLRVTAERDKALYDLENMKAIAESHCNQTRELHAERDSLRSSLEASREQVCQRDRELAKSREEEAYLTLQRDFLLEMTWLDLPSEPIESTKRWREIFEKEWVRKADLEDALARLAAAEARLAEIKKGADADEADLQKMRDGTHLNRSGVVSIIVYQQQDIAELKTRLAAAEADRDAEKAWHERFKRQNDELHADLAATKADKWQPIATAPKDGTWFIGCNAGKAPSIFRWSQRQFDRFANGWEFHGDGLRNPTHWQPLPEPPAQ